MQLVDLQHRRAPEVRQMSPAKATAPSLHRSKSFTAQEKDVFGSDSSDEEEEFDTASVQKNKSQGSRLKRSLDTSDDEAELDFTEGGQGTVMKKEEEEDRSVEEESNVKETENMSGEQPPPRQRRKVLDDDEE